MQVECGKGIAIFDHLVNRRAGSQESAEPLMAFNEDPSATFPNERRIPNELQRVAAALFAMEQNCSAVQRATIPHWLGKVPVHGLGTLQAPFVFFPTPQVVTHREQDQR